MAKTGVEESLKSLPSAKKVALLLVALGQRIAADIMRLLKPNEVKKISFWISRIDHVPQELTERVIKEFYDSLSQRSSVVSIDGREYPKGIFAYDERVFHPDLGNESALEGGSEVLEILNAENPKKLSQRLKTLSPQTVARALSYLEPKRAADIIAGFSIEMQDRILENLTALERGKVGTGGPADPKLMGDLSSLLDSNKDSDFEEHQRGGEETDGFTA